MYHEVTRKMFRKCDIDDELITEENDKMEMEE